MTNKTVRYVVLAVIGMALLFLAIFVVTEDVLNGLCFGAGGAMTALGIGNLIYSLAVPRSRQELLAKAKDIEVHDERNIAIKEKSSTRTSQTMTYLLCALILVFGILGVDVAVLGALAALLPIKAILYIGLTHYYSKQI